MVNEAAAKPGIESFARKVSEANFGSEEGVLSVVVDDEHDAKITLNKTKSIYKSFFMCLSVEISV